MAEDETPSISAWLARQIAPDCRRGLGEGIRATGYLTFCASA
jgi:hypothetical protein